MWDNVELLTSDDTGSGLLSIPSRQECGSALYQMNTLIKITSSQEVLSNPELTAYNLSDGCVLVADRTVVVLDNICQSLQMFVHFETEVDIVGSCQEGQFLVAGERSGSLHLMQVSSKQILLSKELVQRSSDGKTFLDLILEEDSSAEGIYHAFILTSKGFFCIMHLPLAKIQKAITEMDITTAKKLQGEMEARFISVEGYHNIGCLTSVMRKTLNSVALIIGGIGDCVISVWKVNLSKQLISIQNMADSSMIKAAKKLQVVDNLLFVLDNENVLSLWDIPSLTLTWGCPSVLMEEFLLTSESDFSTVAGVRTANLKLIALTTSSNVEQMKNIVIFSLPAMQQLYSLEVANVSALVQSVVNTDTIYFLEGMYENNQKSSASPVSFLVMRSLTEALPENRLSRLLHKHKFTEAENFALQFGLDVELVYKVKVNTLLEGLACEFAGSEEPSAWLALVSQAKETLNKIKGNQFVVEYCLSTPWPTYETAQEMVNYAQARILKKEDESIGHLLDGSPPWLLAEVLQAQAELTTFYNAFGPEKYSGTVWLDFLNNKDIFGNILVQLRGGNLSSAQYLWLRHQAKLERNFSLAMLDDLLASVSLTPPLTALCVWFKEVVVPFVRRVVPHGQKRIAKWLEEGARSLELTDKANWPENGLEMAQVLFSSKDVGEIGLASFSRWDSLKDSCDEEIRCLMELVGALENLVELYRKYNCKLALCNIEKKSADTIVFHMFDKVLVAELIPATLEKYIEPYMCRHGLQKDEILLQYIQNLLQRYNVQSTSIFDTTWEAKATVILGCMSSTELIIEGVLAIMHSAVVPWSRTVEDLVRRYLDMDHPKVKLLEEGYRLMEMKKLLWSYGIRDTSLLHNKQMILMLVKYILKRDTSSALEDALKLANAYMLPTAEVYIWKITDLIDKEKGADVMDLLKSLPLSEAMEVAERTLIWGRLVLEKEIDDADKKQEDQLQVKKVLVEILNFLLSHEKENHWKKDEYEADLKTFKALVALQEGFDICISVKDYCNPSVTSQLLEDNIKSYEKAKNSRTQPENTNARKPLTEAQLYRLASLLQKTEPEMRTHLALRALDNGKVEEALEICSYFYEYHHNEEAGRLLFLACQKLCQMLGSNSPMILPEGLNLPEVINRMACQAATVCSPSLLADVLELCKNTSFALEIHGKCQIEAFGFASEVASLGADKDPFADWMFEEFFTEDGAVLDLPTVLPFAYKIASSNLVPLTEWKGYPLESTSLAYCPVDQGRNRWLSCRNAASDLLSILQECSQHELALGLITNSFGSLFQHIITNTMDEGLSKMLYNQKMLAEAWAFLQKEMQNSDSAVQTIAVALLHKVFNNSRVDHKLALGYCTLLPKTMIFEQLWNIINQAAQNYRKILAISLVGAQLARCYEESREEQAFKDLVTDATWGLKLGDLGISFQNLFRMPAVRKKELLRTLVQHPKVDTDFILQYCRTFLLDTDTALQLYVETHLHNASRTRGESEEEAGASAHDLAVAKALATIPLLSSTANLMASLSTMLHKVDPYDYETIESLLTVIERAGGQVTGFSLNWAMMLLKHLKSYKRVSPPGNLEQQHTFDQAVCLPPAAQARLPFHLIVFRTSECFWKIISAEITEESLPELRLICKQMKVSLDILHMSAANRIFQEQLRPKMLTAMSSGGLTPAVQGIDQSMQAIQSYLLAITNLEWALAVAYKIAQELPTGPTKVQTLKICLSLAEKWLKSTETDESREKARVHLKKLQRQYQKSATAAVLTAHRLNSEDHLKLLSKPASLAILLYQHSSISERVKNPMGRDDPDIHTAAKEIAEINNLDLRKIWDMLLEKWLCPNVLPNNKPSEDFDHDQEDEDLKRIIYLLQLYPGDNCLRILYECTVSAASPIGVNQLTFAHRSRALQALLYLADPAVVESLFKKPIQKVRNFGKCLVHLAELEDLNIPYTYESFHRTPKEGMIKGLWKNHSHEPKAVKLVTELCLEYQVYDPVLWNALLQKLMCFKTVHYLKNVLVKISGIYSLWPIPNYSQAWQSIILVPLLSAVCPLNLDQLEACCRTFKTLLMCPTVANLDLTRIAKQFAQLDLLALALGCLLLIPQPEKRAQKIQGFLTSCQVERLLQQTEDHLSLGETAGIASRIRNSILDWILNEAEDSTAAKYFPLLKMLDRRPSQVKGLIEKLVAKNRPDDAASLERYLQESENPLQPRPTASKMYFGKLT